MNKLRSLCILALTAGSCAPLARAADDDPVYLFTTFHGNGEDGLRFAYSFDGYRWANVPGTFLKPRVGSGLMRDPSLLRGPDGRYRLVWTTAWKEDQGFGYSSSADLVHWSEQKFVPAMVHEPTTVNVWAPELFYDAKREQYVILWASTIPGRFPDGQEESTNNHRMYCTTTKDFVDFAPTKLYLDPGFSVIDCVIVAHDERFVLVLKDNTRPERNISVAFADDPLGPWEDRSTPLTAHLTEGPTVLRTGDDWLIYYDSYGDKSYGALRTRDFRTFEDVSSQVSVPRGHTHGTICQVTRKELAYLIRVGSEQVPQTRLPVDPALPVEELQSRLAEIDNVVARGPYRPDWDSLREFQTPAWYQDAKFGIFIHWGPYAVPAFGSEWYPRTMYTSGTPEFAHHLKTYGPHARFGYKDFIPQFKAEKFDPSAWAELFAAAGAKYVVPVAEHHDGFPMYASDYTDWSAAKRGPGRDVLGELAAALREKGLVVGASSHRAEHWFYFDPGLRIDSDVLDPANADLYGPAVNKRVAENQSEPPDEQFLDDWLLRSCEIVDKYRPQVMYFDWWICQPVFQPYLKRFGAYYYNRCAEWGQPGAINFKDWEGRSFPDGTGVFDIERGSAPAIRADFWQTCTSVSKSSWGYVTNHEYKQAGEIVDDLIDVVSKNGTMLLNIGPQADGTIPAEEAAMLRDIGAWLAINGEAIYGSRPWTRFGEGPTEAVAGSFADTKRDPFTSRDVRFTTKGNVLYAIALAAPADGKLLVTSLAGYGDGSAEDATPRIENVELLGADGPVDWEHTPAGLAAKIPLPAPSEYAVTLKITLRGAVPAPTGTD